MELQCYLRFCEYGLGYLIGKLQLKQPIMPTASRQTQIACLQGPFEFT